MLTATSCPACGVVLPGRLVRCPACGVRPGRRPVGFRVIVVTVAAILAIGAVVWVGFVGRGRSPLLTVEVTPGVSRLSPDARGTDVVATIDNPNPMPVDVTVRVRGIDIAKNVVAEATLGPYRGLRPGAVRPIRHHFATTPLDSVAFEAVEVTPSDLDGP